MSGWGEKKKTEEENEKMGEKEEKEGVCEGEDVREKEKGGRVKVCQQKICECKHPYAYSTF